MTFEWEEITDELLEKVVYFSYEKSGGGLGDTGQPDYLHAITEDGQEYLFGLSECPYVNWETEIIDRLLGECPTGLSDHDTVKWRLERRKKMKQTHEIGKWHWDDLYEGNIFYGGNIFIRKDHYDKIYSEWKTGARSEVYPVWKRQKSFLIRRVNCREWFLRKRRQDGTKRKGGVKKQRNGE